jgi:hypothetical protein
MGFQQRAFLERGHPILKQFRSEKNIARLSHEPYVSNKCSHRDPSDAGPRKQ